MKINFTGWIEVSDDLDDRGSVDIELAGRISDEIDKYDHDLYEEPGELFAPLNLTWEVAT